MADAREEPPNETPAQRRVRLLNLNNPEWEPEPEQPASSEEVPFPIPAGGVTSGGVTMLGDGGPETVVKSGRQSKGKPDAS